ncbi:hypothetical protein HDU81_009851 [Chytriomyces hyalinus]|nr:hypothetical protein HDU81_009851 [Chytriomyces hyalinus]
MNALGYTLRKSRIRQSHVSLLLANVTGDLHPLTLDKALYAAAEGKDAALDESVRIVHKLNLPISLYLIEYGVSPSILNGVLERVRRKRPGVELQFLQHHAIDPSYEDNALLYESARNSNCKLTKHLLADERVAGTVRYDRLIRLALSSNSTDHVLLCLEMAEKLKNWKVVPIVEEYLDSNEAPTDFKRTYVQHCRK